MLLLHAVIAREEIIRQLKIKETILRKWNSRNIAGGAENIHHIKKQDKL